jgi:Lipoprotein LpqB beta-propeller domain/Sporulation and spore germination
MRRTIAGLAALAVLATGCSGVPTSSKPQVIGPAQGGPAEPVKPTNTPQPGAEPRTIVQEFLRANVTEPLDRAAHEFLTPDEQRKWSDQTVTILSGSLENADVGLQNLPGNPPHAVGIKVSGTQIGSLGPEGTYSPAPPGSGGSGQPWSYQYGLDPVNGQYRISDAPTGLVVYADEFAQVYRPVRLYFYDQSEQHLVPDVRYTAVESPQDVATWELRQLIAGPTSPLADAVHSDLPNPPANPSVSIGTDGSMRIELPSGSRLDGDTKKRVAAQLIMTFANSQPQLALTITDGGVPVDIPDLPAQITKATLQRDPVTADLFNNNDPMPVFYLDARHRLVTGDSGQAVAGPLGLAGRYDLTSVAVASVKPEDDYYVAATVGTGSDQTFWIGRAQTGPVRTSVPRGQLTRPSWAAGLTEAWVANGANLYRVSWADGGLPPQVSTVPTALQSGNRITALRLSPEGSRIAMIVQGPAGFAQLFVGAVVRTGSGSGDNNSVRIDSAQPIMPPSYHLSDVAWSDDMTLWVVGSNDSQRNSHGIWSVTVDGANIREQSTTNLPLGADSIATGPGVLPWVSAGGYVFELSTDWEGPNHHTTPGTAPVYLE